MVSFLGSAGLLKMTRKIGEQMFEILLYVILLAALTEASVAIQQL